MRTRRSNLYVVLASIVLLALVAGGPAPTRAATESLNTLMTDEATDGSMLRPHPDPGVDEPSRAAEGDPIKDLSAPFSGLSTSSASVVQSSPGSHTWTAGTNFATGVGTVPAVRTPAVPLSPEDLEAVFVTFTSTVDGGMIDVTPPQPPEGYAPGTVITITALSDYCYEFTGWTGDMVAYGTQTPVVIILVADLSFGAKFSLITYAALTVNIDPAGVGMVTIEPASGPYGCGGTTITATATATETPWAFDYWRGAATGNDNPVRFILDEYSGTLLTAHFIIACPPAPSLYTILNPDGNGDYTVDWSDVTGATSYTLQEDYNADFTSPTTRYSGSDSQCTVSGQAAGTWYYRVKATNAAGDSSWSNTESVVVNPCNPVNIVSLESDSPVSVGDSMHFTATVIGTEPITYTWDFGGTGTAGGADTATPAFTYDEAGMYTVTTYVEGPCGTDEDFVYVAVTSVAPSAPILYTISNPDGDGDYTVDWSDVTGANTYTLEEDDNADFTSPTTRYSGSDSQYAVSGQAAGTWYYRVKASNAAGDSPWSNVESITVQPSEGDGYEPDDTCAQAQPILTDGTVQFHTFHDQADTDWATFDAISDTTYLIEAQIPAGSPADVVLELYDQCDALPLDGQGYTFSPGVRLEFQAPASGPFYLKWLNDQPSVYGPDVAYHLSVRALGDEPTPGALVLVAGRLKENDSLQDNIHYVTDAVYQLFLAHGYDDSRIYYLATDTGLDGVDALATEAALESAITTWAQDKVGPDRPFTLYMMDHGNYDKFYLDNPRGERVRPEEVDGWLTQLEAAAPGVKVNVIVEACKSGSFIDLPQTVSEPGRVVIASTGAWKSAWPSDEGAIFSDHFIAALEQGASLYAGFQTAQWAVWSVHCDQQTPWLDDNGDGIADEEDGQEAARRGFAFAGTLAGEEWPPYIVQAPGPTEVERGQGVIQAKVLDDDEEGVKRVWAVIYPPSYQPPEPGEEMPQETLPTIVLLDQGNDWYGATYTGFDEMGVYRVVIYAEDGDGLEARPLAIEVRTGWAVYLPLVMRG